MGLLKILESVLVPLVIGLGSCIVTLYINKTQREDRKEERETGYEEEQNRRIQALEQKMDVLSDSIKAVIVQTNENSAMNHRLLGGLTVLIDAGEVNGTINGPGKSWLKDTQEYVISKGFQQMEIKSLQSKKKKNS